MRFGRGSVLSVAGYVERAAEELRAADVYINRPTTGAVVGRQPFGGYGLSGVGSKAGGPNYLLQFLTPRTVTENTLRQGINGRARQIGDLAVRSLPFTRFNYDMRLFGIPFAHPHWIGPFQRYNLLPVNRLNWMSGLNVRNRSDGFSEISGTGSSLTFGGPVMKNRLAVVALIAVLALVAPSASTALIDGKASNAGASKYDEHLTSALERAPDEVSVIVSTDGPPEAAAANARALGARVTWVYEIIDAFAAKMRPAVLNVIASRTDVSRIHLDREVGPVMDVSHRAIEADKAWASGHRGAGISVAVIDTGIDPLHPFFAGAIVSCVSTIAGVVSPECIDTDGHGTHVAGTVASRDDRYPGVAPAARLAVVRVLHAAGAGTSADIIAGMDWVQDNKDRVSPPIRVATMSIGLLNPGCGDGTGPQAEAANNLVSAGVFFSVAAGNSGHEKCTIDGASAAAKVTTIAAVDDKATVPQNDDVIADFSSGGSSKNGKPDVSFPGVGITSSFIGAGLLVLTMDGTSMATPHAAGTAALLLSKESSLTAQQVKDRITGTAVKTKNTGSTFNYLYGHGLGNACRTLQLATCGATAPLPDPTKAQVAAIDMKFEHVQRTGHRVSATVRVVDAQNVGVEGATVAVQFTSPEGSKYTASDATDSTGVAIVSTKQSKGGHGTWTVCVTSVSGTNLTYDSTANVESCDSIVVG